MKEVIRLLNDSGQLEDGLSDVRDTIRRIPAGIREAIGRRLNRLSAGCNEVLAIAAGIVLTTPWHKGLFLKNFRRLDEYACMPPSRRHSSLSTVHPQKTM